jgi:hypothetical protein
MMAKAKPATHAVATVRLHERTEALAIVEQFIAEADGELTPELEALLDEAVGDWTQKLAAYFAVIEEHETEAQALKELAARVAARSKRLTEKADWLRGRAIATMQAREVPEIAVGTVRGLLVNNPTKVETLLQDAPALMDLMGVAYLDPAATTLPAALLACVVITEAQEIPASAAWDKAALVQLWKGAQGEGMENTALRAWIATVATIITEQRLKLT